MTRVSPRPGSESVATPEPGMRPFDPHRDFPAVVELIRAVNRHDEIDWFPTVASLESEWARTPTFDPARDQVVIEDGGRFVAAAGVDWRERAGKVVHRIEVWTHPESRRRGLGRRLLEWSERRAKESVADGSGGPPELPHVLGLGTDRDNPAGVEFAASAGYVPVRYSLEMWRQLAQPIPDAPLPTGLEIRPVRPEDHRAIWDADVEAFRDHWESAVRNETDFVQAFSHPDLDTSLWQVAWDGDEVVGMVMIAIYADENKEIGVELGWLDQVSVRRPWRRRGLATALIARSMVILRERGMAVAALGVDAENPTGALGVYERLGFRPHRTWVTYRKPL
jgi:mycothiol synthase